MKNLTTRMHFNCNGLSHKRQMNLGQLWNNLVDLLRTRV